MRNCLRVDEVPGPRYPGGAAACENCGKEDPTTLCPSCAHYRKKDAARAAQPSNRREPNRRPRPPRSDLAELRERLRRVQEGLTEPS